VGTTTTTPGDEEEEGTNTRQHWWLCRGPLRKRWQESWRDLRSPVPSPRDSLRVISAFDQPLLTRTGPLHSPGTQQLGTAV